MMNKVIIESVKIDDIPCMLFHQEGAKNQPLVIFAHGFNCDKYDGAAMALKLAQRGFCAITFDLYKQGERYDGFLENITCDADFGYNLFNTIKSSYNDIEKILHTFTKDPRIDINRVGITGGSLGGMLCFYTLTQNEDIKVSVPIIGTPNFVQQLMSGMEKEREEDFTQPKEKEILEFVKSIDPANILLEKETRPMLIINASKDDDIPVPQDFFNKIKPRYDKDNRPIELFIADEFHFMSREMIDKAIDWFEKYL